VTKLAIDLVADQLAQSQGLSLVRMRPMNHTGPRQAAGFVIPDFAKQIVEIELGLVEPLLRVGNLKAYRDFTDVRDIARAYALAAEHGRAGEAYIICSGESRLIQDALDTLLSFSKVPIAVERDPEKFRPVDANIIDASPSRFTAVTGWRPEVPFHQTLQDTLDYWRDKFRTGSLQH
jgi:GDP-4-dehydro-6-deoxy-D-mannose reductase